VSIPDKIYVQNADEIQHAYDSLGAVVEKHLHAVIEEEAAVCVKWQKDRVNADDVLYIRAGKVRRLLQAAIYALKYVGRHYLSQSSAAEVWAHCNGYGGTPDIVAAIKELDGEY